MTDFQHIGDLAENVVRRIDDTAWNGKQITKPGVYTGIDLDTYHQKIDLFDGFSISSTGLKQVIQRPSLYWAYSPFNPKKFEKETKSHLSLGAAAHALILGDEVFGDRYAVKPTEYLSKKWNGNRNNCKEWLAEKEEAGLIVVSEADIETIGHMSESLSRNKLVQLGILNGKVERTICANVKGVWLRARPDVLPVSSGDVADLKTASQLDDDNLYRTIFNFGYHIQAGLTKLVFDEVFGPGYFQSFSFVFVETTAPYDCRVMQLKDEAIDLGVQQVNHALGVINHCLASGNWYGFDGPSGEPGWCDLPTWASTRIRNELQLENAT